MATRQEILAQLQALTRSRARESRLEISADPIYVMVIGQEARREVRLEAVSSIYLPKAQKLTSERAMLLRRAGYQKGGASRNWARVAGTSDDELERIADELLELLTTAYAVDGEALQTRLTHDDTEHPQNAELVAAMTEIAGDSSNESKRVALYNAMLNATFLVPLDPDADDAADGGEEFHVLERIQNRPVFGVFTDWDALRLWKPRAWPYIPVHGSDLFQMLLEQSLASLDINPQGRTGGQLYAHEVETLARAVKHWKRKHLH